MKIIFFLIFTIFSPIYSALGISEVSGRLNNSAQTCALLGGGLIAGYALTKLALHVSKNISQMPSFSKVKPFPEKHSFEVVEYDKEQHGEFLKKLMEAEKEILNIGSNDIDDFVAKRTLDSIVVLKDNNRLVGFATYSLIASIRKKDSLGGAYIHLLAVDKKERKKGGAKFLGKYLIEHFKKENLTYVHFNTHSSNTIAQQFYERIAFSGSPKIYYDNFKYYIPLNQSLWEKIITILYFGLYGDFPPFYFQD